MFLQNARAGQNKWWQYLLTVLFIIVGAVVGQVPFGVVLAAKIAQSGASSEEVAEMMETLEFAPLGIDSNATLVLALLAFVGALSGLWLGVTLLHKKPFRLLATPQPKVNWRKILFSFALWMGLSAAVELVFFALDPGNYAWQFDPARFFVLLLICLFLLPLQTSCEELVFRGYFMQGLSLISRYRWIPLLLTSVSFGAMHYANPEVEAFGTTSTMVMYIGTGLFLGILTLMDDSLELALGVHAATNIYSALFVTFDASALQTAALLHMAQVRMDWMLAGFFAAAAAFTWIVSKKYGWRDWTKTCGRIEQPHSEPV